MKRRVWFFGITVAAAALGCRGNVDSHDTVPTTCTAISGLPTLCTDGRCRAVAPAGALKTGEKISIADLPAPSSLQGDAITPFVCQLSIPPDTNAPVGLVVDTQNAALPSDAIVFRHDPSSDVAMHSVASGPMIDALVTSSGVYGATRRAEASHVELFAPLDPLSSNNTQTLLRNVSLQTINAAFWDGTHLFVGEGPRVLVYNGIPANPAVKPALVLGQPELDRIIPGTSASIMGAIGAIWSDGKKLVVANGHRVLIWNTIPATSFAPADLVLGQQDFVSTTPNLGGVSASTMMSPRGVDSDGQRLIVADTLNHRALVWNTFPTSIGEPATSVLGQASFETNAIGQFYQAWDAKLDGAGALVASYYTGGYHFPDLEMYRQPDFTPLRVDGAARIRPDAVPLPSSITRTGDGGLATFDTSGRIAMHRVAPTTTTAMDFSLGQPDLTRVMDGPVSASTISSNGRVVASNGLLLVPDVSRVLVYEQPPSYNFEPAQRVLGQAGFTTNDRGVDYRRISNRTLAYPSDVAVRGSTVAVADRGNNRVLLYTRDGLTATNAPAAIVLGQPDGTAFVPNVDQVSASALTLSGPAGVALDDKRLIVADTENHRVLVWSPIPTMSATPATFVLGQTDFAGHRPNRGRSDADLDGNCDAGDDGMFYPTGVATDGTRLFVADRINNRVLVWSDLGAISNGKPADHVLGQASFTATRANHGNGAYAPRLDGFNLPMGVTLQGTSLWVSDTENNRLVRWDGITSPATATPAVVVGQANGTSVSNPNYFGEDTPSVGERLKQPTTASSVLRPRGVTFIDDVLYVSEADSHRVHLFTPAQGGGYAPAGLLGQASMSTGLLNEGGIGPASLAAPMGLAAYDHRLFVADSGNHRVLGFDVVGLPSAATRLAAATVIGQTSAVANGFNQSAAVTAGGATRPRGIAIDGGDLLVAETSRHRVLVHELPLVPGKEPKLVLGQPDESLSLPNSGGTPTATSLASPQAVFADHDRIIVADAGNHRVLIYPRSAPPSGAPAASLVLGQATFADASPNRGGSPTAATLSAPSSVYSDGQKLVIADTGNNRVLVWSAIPTTNGQPADLVLGQDDFVNGAPNRGTGSATAATFAVPLAVHMRGGALFVADSGNNRVVVFDSLPTTSGAAGSKVLGQPDTASRAPTADINDARRLAGPVALASDGANLYVADRDANRVVGYGLESLATGAAARMLFNANTSLNALGPSGLAIEPTALFTTRLYVSDTNNDQLVVLGSVSRLR